MKSDPSGDTYATWEEHYTAKPQVWSGRVNVRLAEIVPELTGTRALDLGCGEGGDAVWLAEQGWTVVAIDVSTTALDRGRAAAQERGVADRIEFAQYDLDSSFPAGEFDLVSAQFLHSPVEKDRPAILRRAAAAVAPGGTLLIVDHGAAPPWATKMHDHVFPPAESVLAGLELDSAQWQPIQVGVVDRDVQGPDGQPASLADNVIRIRRAVPSENG
ncbi:MAG: SAM-dependent methyltransferase [Mycobacterium sp.]